MLKGKGLLSIGPALLFACTLRSPVCGDTVLFEDDFESDSIGDEPAKWTYDPTSEVTNHGQVAPDPLDPANQVFTGFGGYWADNGADYTDFIAEWDWMFAQDNNRNNSIGFRVQGPTAHYQLSRRGGGVLWQIYMFNGTWNAIATSSLGPSQTRGNRTLGGVKRKRLLSRLGSGEPSVPLVWWGPPSLRPGTPRAATSTVLSAQPMP